MFRKQYLEYGEYQKKNGEQSQNERYSVLKIPFIYRKFKNYSKNYLEVSYDAAGFIYGLNTKENCRNFININYKS